MWKAAASANALGYFGSVILVSFVANHDDDHRLEFWRHSLGCVSVTLIDGPVWGSLQA
jgi:hypothetical protein